MLVFSTKLYVKKELTDETFIDMAIEWVSGGPNYTFGKIEWNKGEEYTIENKEKTQSFTIMKYSDVVIIHLVNKDGKVIWTSDFILRTIDQKKVLAVFLYNDAVDMSVKLPKVFNRPILLKRVISRSFAEIDNDIETNGKAVYINNDNLDIAAKLINGESEYFMPVIYITPDIYTSSYRLDHERLAEDLAGVAHVIVEQDSTCTKELRKVTDGKNPYNGAVQVFYSPKITQRLLPNDFENTVEFRKEVTNTVFRKLILSKIDDEFSWTKIRYNKLKAKTQECMDLEHVFDEILEEYEEKLEYSGARIEELEDEIRGLKGKIYALEEREHIKRTKTAEICLNTQEISLYDHEMEDVILKILKKELSSMRGDPNLEESRKYHILESVIQQNEISDTPRQVVDVVSSALKTEGRISKTGKRMLEDVGFRIEDGSHYKLIFGDDDRYMITLAKTSSDHRAMKNAVTKIENILFGY